MKTSRKTLEELQAWLDRRDENGAVPDGIELAPEPTLPVGQRRRSPGGVEVVKTDDWTTNPWRGTRGLAWFTDAEVADWGVITDAPEE